MRRPALLLLWAAACSPGPGRQPDRDAGPDAGTPEGGYLAPLDPAVVGARLAAAECQRQTRCAPALYDFLATDEAGCIREGTALHTGALASYQPAIAAGRARYAGERLESCLLALASADCAPDIDDGACDLIDGRLALNAGCHADFECGGGLHCEVPHAGGCGLCRPRAQHLASCASAPCDRRLTCYDLGTPQAPDPRCVPTDAAEGGNCGTAESGFCRGNLECVGAAARTCRRRATAGQACDPAGGDLPRCDALARLACVNGTCVEARFGGLGAACDGTAQRCTSAGYCEAANGRCTSFPRAGEACLSGQCAPDHYCEAGTCAAVKGAGQACAAGGECVAGLSCLGPPGSATCQSYVWASCP